jgi:hypothetical protein
MIRTGTFALVPWPLLGDYLARGWMAVSDLGPTHGTWSLLMWRCDCGVAA